MTALGKAAVENFLRPGAASTGCPLLVAVQFTRHVVRLLGPRWPNFRQRGPTQAGRSNPPGAPCPDAHSMTSIGAGPATAPDALHRPRRFAAQSVDRFSPTAGEKPSADYFSSWSPGADRGQETAVLLLFVSTSFVFCSFFYFLRPFSLCSPPATHWRVPPFPPPFSPLFGARKFLFSRQDGALVLAQKPVVRGGAGCAGGLGRRLSRLERLRSIPDHHLIIPNPPCSKPSPRVFPGGHHRLRDPVSFVLLWGHERAPSIQLTNSPPAGRARRLRFTTPRPPAPATIAWSLAFQRPG